MTADDLDGNEGTGSERRRARAADVERLEARVGEMLAAVKAAEDRRSTPLTWLEFCNIAFPALLSAEGSSKWRTMHQRILDVFNEYRRAVSGKSPRNLNSPDDPDAPDPVAAPVATEAGAGC